MFKKIKEGIEENKKSILSLKVTIENYKQKLRDAILDTNKSLKEEINEAKIKLYEQEILLDNFKKDKIATDVKVEYFKTVISDIAEDYKTLLSEICNINAKKKVEKESLELKWQNEKLKKGEMIVQKGADIINKRKEVYDAMLEAERKGHAKEFENLKQRLIGFDWIVEKLNEKK